MQNPVYFVVGPTAAGKTSAAILLAQRLGGEVVSADSMQIYRRMDIGTAKPSMEERQGILHHMIDVAEPDVPYSVADFQNGAQAAIANILKNGCVPVVAGGTGLYVHSLLYPMDFTQAAADERFRREMEQWAATQAPGALHERLREVDPASAARLHPNDQKRLIRALEVYHITGKPMSENGRFDQLAAQLPYQPRLLGLRHERELLNQRINARVDIMMRQGFLEEVRELHVPRDMPSMQGLGYRELLAHLAGEMGLEETVELIKLRTRQFAKRQMTWFRRDARIQWYDAAPIEDIVDAFLNSTAH